MSSDDPPAVEVRLLHSADELAAVDELYREVFGVRDTGLNPRLLTAIADNGGALVGACEGGTLVAFGLSLLARDPHPGAAGDGLFHYSQTVGVAAHRQGAGLGRLVKHAQRDAALAAGLDRMRWVFDPLQARNARFNLDVLGGRIRSLRRDYYGWAAPGVDRGEPTDRCVLDWDLRAGYVRRDSAIRAPGLRAGEVRTTGDVTLIGLPRSWRTLRTTLPASDAAALRESVVAALEQAFAEGVVAVSCVPLDDDVAAYVLVPERDVARWTA